MATEAMQDAARTFESRQNKKREFDWFWGYENLDNCLLALDKRWSS